MSVEKSGRPITERMARVGEAVMNLSAIMQGYRATSIQVTGFTVRGPADRGGEFLITVRAIDEEGQPIVAFNSAVELDDALQGVYSRMMNGTLKWRPDQYAR